MLIAIIFIKISQNYYKNDQILHTINPRLHRSVQVHVIIRHFLSIRKIRHKPRSTGAQTDTDKRTHNQPPGLTQRSTRGSIPSVNTLKRKGVYHMSIFFGPHFHCNDDRTVFSLVPKIHNLETTTLNGQKRKSINND